MDERFRAEEHLRAIRSLMERATIYRAIAAPSALLGGLLSLLLGSSLLWWRPVIAASGVTMLWLLVLLITGTANLFSLKRDAARRGEPFVSRGMREALRALSPSFLVVGVCTLVNLNYPDSLCIIWCVGYGLALLATSHFAPPSMTWLGRAFLFIGLLAIAAMAVPFPTRSMLFEHEWPYTFSSAFMAGTFGLFHLVYAAVTWRTATSGANITPLTTADA